MHLNEGIKEGCIKVIEAEGASLTEGVGLDNTDVNLIEGGKLKEESVKNNYLHKNYAKKVLDCYN